MAPEPSTPRQAQGRSHWDSIRLCCTIAPAWLHLPFVVFQQFWGFFLKKKKRIFFKDKVAAIYLLIFPKICDYIFQTIKP
jgi:hypothetical protein